MSLNRARHRLSRESRSGMSIGLGLAAFVLAALLTRAMSRPGSRLVVLDHPNDRSLHEMPTPTGGGVGIGLAIFAAGLAAVVLVPSSGHVLWIAPGALVIAAVSFVDDRRHLSVPARLLTQALVAGLLLAGGLVVRELELPGLRWEAPLLVALTASALYAVWSINLYNFMDGMDGFAAGMSIIGFGTFALLATGGDHPLFVALCVSIAGAAGGFLPFNFPPARIFMGDVGSSLLGFLVAALSLWAAVDGIFPLWVAILVFSPFVVDATVTLVRRALSGHEIWRAHKTHYYQRLVQLGWGHRRTVIAQYLVMCACAVSALVAIHWDPARQWLLLAAWALAYTAAMVSISRAEARRARGPHAVN